MAETYNHKVVEGKWQKVWDDNKAFAATDDYSKPKYYALVEFPYPSGQGLHVGHPRPYTALDIVARKRRMQGYNVLYPMGWDAFGLPTENYAIKNKIHPKEVTKTNVARFKKQLHSLGYSSTGTERSTQLILNITSGHSGYSSNSSRLVSHTRRRCLSTGVHHVRLVLQMRRLSMAYVSVVAARLSARLSLSGCSRSQITQTSSLKDLTAWITSSV